MQQFEAGGILFGGEEEGMTVGQLNDGFAIGGCEAVMIRKSQVLDGYTCRLQMLKQGSGMSDSRNEPRISGGGKSRILDGAEKNGLIVSAL